MKTIAEHLADSFVFCVFSVQTERLFYFLSIWMLAVDMVMKQNLKLNINSSAVCNLLIIFIKVHFVNIFKCIYNKRW